MEQLLLPDIVIKKLKEAATRSGVSPEELAGEIILNELSSDPRDRISLYVSLCNKYIKEAEDLIARKDYIQASEKIWGAAASCIKAAAIKKVGKRLTSHGELWEFVSKLIDETGDQELGLLWRTAISMHVNFYENWAPPEEVVRALEHVKKFVGKIFKYTGLGEMGE